MKKTFVNLSLLVISTLLTSCFNIFESSSDSSNINDASLNPTYTFDTSIYDESEEIFNTLQIKIFPNDYYLEEGTILPATYTIKHKNIDYNFDISWKIKETLNYSDTNNYVTISDKNEIVYLQDIKHDFEQVILECEISDDTKTMFGNLKFEYRLKSYNYDAEIEYQKYYNSLFNSTDEEIDIKGIISCVNINQYSSDYGNMFIIDENYEHGYFVYLPLKYEENKHKEFVENYKVGRKINLTGKAHFHRNHAELKFKHRSILDYEYTNIAFNKDDMYKDATEFFENATNTDIKTFFRYQNLPITLKKCKFVREDSDSIYFVVGDGNVEYRIYKADHYVNKSKIDEMITSLKENQYFDFKGIVSYYNDLQLLITDEDSISIIPDKEITNLMNDTLDNLYSYYQSNAIYKEKGNYDLLKSIDNIEELVNNNISIEYDVNSTYNGFKVIDNYLYVTPQLTYDTGILTIKVKTKNYVISKEVKIYLNETITDIKCEEDKFQYGNFYVDFEIENASKIELCYISHHNDNYKVNEDRYNEGQLYVGSFDNEVRVYLKALINNEYYYGSYDFYYMMEQSYISPFLIKYDDIDNLYAYAYNTETDYGFWFKPIYYNDEIKLGDCKAQFVYSIYLSTVFDTITFCSFDKDIELDDLTCKEDINKSKKYVNVNYDANNKLTTVEF